MPAGSATYYGGMKILVINSGSSSLKFDLIRTGEGADAETDRTLAGGSVDRIGHDSSVSFKASSGLSHSENTPVKDHREAARRIMEWLRSASAQDPALSLSDIQAVGHRVVHGGERFVTPVLISDSVLAALEELVELAPLHNPAAIQGIRACGEMLGPGIPMVAVFDTAFHSTIPEYAATYALPHEVAERNSIKRYGFHGIAHEYMLNRYSRLAGVNTAGARIITLQLGNGCSAAAIKGGRSVDTSMGFTPLEGLVMGTRSGDLDAGIIGYLGQKEDLDIKGIERMLNERSGLLGVSGRSQDMRDLLGARDSEPRAALAIDVFCYRVRKYIGAYLAALDGADAIVFGGGIGEHAPAVRSQICNGLEWCGLVLDPALNEALASGEGRISADNASIHAYVVSVDEAVLIAQYTAQFIDGNGRHGYSSD